VGPFNAYGSILSLLLTPFGASVQQVATLGAASVFVGVVSTVVLGGLLDRTRAYKVSLITSSILPVIALIGLLYSLPVGIERFPLVLASGMIYTSIVMAAIPMCMSFSAEVTYPMQASTVNGLLQLFCQIVSGVISLSGVNYLSVDFSEGGITQQ
jgi:hypothetical protein